MIEAVRHMARPARSESRAEGELRAVAGFHRRWTGPFTRETDYSTLAGAHVLLFAGAAGKTRLFPVCRKGFPMTMIRALRFRMFARVAAMFLAASAGPATAWPQEQQAPSGRSAAADAAPTDSQLALRYQVVPLELRGFGEARALRVNSDGTVVGFQRRGGSSMICVWSNDGKLLEPLSGKEGLAESINESGQIVGAMGVGERVAAFLFDGSRVRALSLPPVYVSANATAINKRGLAAGFAVHPFQGPQAVMFGEDGVRTLGSLGGGTAEVNAIGPEGQVVGQSTTRRGDTHAFLWADGRMTDLGTLGGDESMAQDINESGLIVGMAENGNAVVRACAWENGRIRDLGALRSGGQSWAFGCNRHGQICGWAEVGFNRQHGVLWHAGRIIDLNDRISEPDSWTVLDARGIADNGLIAARAERAERRGENQPVLLVPLATAPANED